MVRLTSLLETKQVRNDILKFTFQIMESKMKLFSGLSKSQVTLWNHCKSVFAL